MHPCKNIIEHKFVSGLNLFMFSNNAFNPLLSLLSSLSPSRLALASRRLCMPETVWTCVSASFLQMRCRLFLGSAWRGCKWKAGQVLRATVDEITHGPIIPPVLSIGRGLKGDCVSGCRQLASPFLNQSTGRWSFVVPSPLSPSITLQINDWSENRLDEFHF